MGWAIATGRPACRSSPSGHRAEQRGLEAVHQECGGQRSRLDAVVLLDADGVLSDEAMEIVCDYTQALFDSSEDPAMQWLPTWAWQRAEQIQRQLSLDLVQAGDAAVYTASRRFLVEHPAGEARELTDARNDAGARQVAQYVDIPRDRLFRFAPGQDGLCW